MHLTVFKTQLNTNCNDYWRKNANRLYFWNLYALFKPEVNWPEDR